MFRLFECCALSFFERFVLSFSLKIERFVSDSAEIWICGLYADNTNLVIATGPYLACGVGGKAKFDGDASVGGIHINGDDKIDTFGDDGLDYNRFDAGWNIGLGVEFGKILVGLDTQLGFCKVMDGDAPHNANIGITLGYKF